MNIWIYLRTFVVWLWRGVRAWFEVGRRLSQIELEIQQQVVTRNREVAQLQRAISTAAETERSGFDQIRHQLQELENQQREQLVNLDRALQNRVDEWARQLSGQMNQLYAAIARNPVEAGKG